MNNRVVITGMGMISCAGTGVEENWSNIVAGRSGIGEVTLCDKERLPVKIAGEVKGFNPKDYIRDRKALKIMYRNVKLGLAAAKMAYDDSGLENCSVDPHRFGAIIGSGGGGYDEGPDNKDLADVIKASWDEGNKLFDSSKFGSEGLDRLHPLWLLKTLCNNLFCYISIYYNAQGVNDNVVTSFAGGSNAIGDAFMAIRRGDVDVSFAGGYDTLAMASNFFCYYNHNMLTSNSNDGSSFRPFDRDRDGFVLGEGAGLVILEELSHAKKRDAKIYGEIVGYGNTSNASHLYEYVPDGSGIADAVRKACKIAGINTDAIDYVNVDGLGTIESDIAETRAVKAVFADNAHNITLSATKPVVAHTGAAAGAMELMICALAIDRKVVPPTINLTNQDPDCDLDYCSGTAREMEINAALSINQGFGGQNAALIVKKFKD